MKFSLLVCSLLSALVYSDYKEDLVDPFPMIPGNKDFMVYSGYLPLKDTNGKKIHYVFTESQRKPSDDPVVLWLNGGPGCSSMDGMFYENGPFVFPEGEADLIVNQYAWNRVANMLYFEAPAGVGYSILGNSSNFNTNDNITAENNLEALVVWFNRFTDDLHKFQENEFYIAGESYGGIYVPTLAYHIIQHNKNSPELKINLKGILVGNGVVDWNFDVMNARPSFAWWHGLIGYSTWIQWEANGCTAFSDNLYCVEVMNHIDSLMNDVNIYDVYRRCVYEGVQSDSKHLYTQWAQGRFKESIPCVDDYGLTRYFNLPLVRKAFNIDESCPTWSVCRMLNYTIDYALGSYYVYPTLVNSGLRVLIYSGDTDYAVPVNGSKMWIRKLTQQEGMEVVKEWREWVLDGQVAGFVIDYSKNFRFMTIKGTGHMSIQWKRPEGFHMFESFLKKAGP